MTVLTPEFTEAPLTPVGDWHPTRYTPSLSGTEDFPSAGDRLIAACEAGAFKAAGVARFTLDPWQRWLIRHVLEKYPDDWPVEHLRGQLRYRQVVISMGRQNGKSLIAALFVMWGLTMHVGGPSVVGFASSEKQAKIVYKRLGYAIRRSPMLRRLLKYTLTQGITRHDGAGEYITIPADEDAAQGIPITLGLGDELHICPPELWAAIVNGQRAQASSLLVGITTAGDDDSSLLLRLYEQIDAAIDGKHERFGGFVWEAPEGANLTDESMVTLDDGTEISAADHAIVSANPAIACGRVPLAQVKTDAALQPEPDQQRYLFNRFISSTNAWLPMGLWRDAPRRLVTPADPGVVLAIHRTPDWSWASVVASSRDPETGVLRSSLVTSIPKPSHARLVAIAERLAERAPGVRFVMDGLLLKSVAKALKDKGHDVVTLSLTDHVGACSTAYANLARHNVEHDHHPTLARQHRDARRKNVSDGWRISAEASVGDVDAVLALVFALHGADTTEAPVLQVF